MRFRIILTVFFWVLNCQLFAQTKLIAHKSHSGNSETFKAALRNNDPDLQHSNFGRAPERTIRTAQLDSLIFVSPVVAIMVTSNYCQDFREEHKSLWRAGRDTVYNHPLFSQQHNLNGIKETLEKEYHFRNPVSSVKFIGYDNKKNGSLKQNSSPILPFFRPDPDQKPPFLKVSLALTGLIGFCFLIIRIRLNKRLQLKLQSSF